MKSIKTGLAVLLATVAILFSTPGKASVLDAIGSFYIPNSTLQLEQEVRCLARNIFYEAGAEPYKGKLAVGLVTVNRARSNKFKADTVCSVVKQKAVVRGKPVCQFSWYCSGKAYAEIPINTKGYQESLAAAKKILLHDYTMPGFRNAFNFHAVTASPSWRHDKTIVERIGNHIFYRD